MRANLLILALCGAVLAGGFGGQRDDFRRFHDENDAAQAALEGKAPPPIVATEWLNSTPLNLGELKGKVVLLDMWAYW